MNTATCYTHKAQSTRSKRQYPTVEQKLAFKALVSVGEKYLNAEALQLLATHPHLTYSQRQHFAVLAAAA